MTKKTKRAHHEMKYDIDQTKEYIDDKISKKNIFSGLDNKVGSSTTDFIEHEKDRINSVKSEQDTIGDIKKDIGDKNKRIKTNDKTIKLKKETGELKDETSELKKDETGELKKDETGELKKETGELTYESLPNYTEGICCFCESECNVLSQCCGRCARIMTWNSIF